MVILSRNVTATVEVMTVCFLTLVDYFNQDVHLCIDKSTGCCKIHSLMVYKLTCMLMV